MSINAFYFIAAFVAFIAHETRLLLNRTLIYLLSFFDNLMLNYTLSRKTSTTQISNISVKHQRIFNNFKGSVDTFLRLGEKLPRRTCAVCSLFCILKLINY